MDEESAREWATIPVQDVKIDHEGKRVTVRALLYSSTAAYQGERYGCTLD
jgi:ribosomal protein L18E